MRAITLDVFIDAPDVEHSNFSSHDSIFEYDIAFWDPANTLQTYSLEPGKPYYKGSPRLDSHDSVRVLQDILRRRKEFQEFLNMGRTIVVFMAPPQQFYFDTGKRDKSGTGRNQQVTVLLEVLDLQEKVIPYKIQASAGQGRGVSPKHDTFRALWRTHRDRWSYRAVLDEFPGETIAVVEGTGKCIAAQKRNNANGMLILLPDMDGPDFEEVRETQDVSQGDLKIDENPDTEIEVPEEYDPASVDLLTWVRSLRSESGDVAPPWLQRFQFQEERRSALTLSEIKGKMAQLASEMEELENTQRIAREWKRLVYSQGTPLEQQAIAAFRLLGFDAHPGPEGRADIIMTRNECRAAVEVKGLSKSAGERNAAQLEKWVSGEIAEGTPKVKGILVVNAWRDLAPDLRTEPAFPAQMISFSERREHCLISGIQLLAMVRHCMENPDQADSIAQKIIQTVGVLSGWNELPKLFGDSPDDSESK
ncbi:hypothetical protein ACIBBB_27045 [Streptomyces sp. NPDC051217]|uniref:hypothetical protein n=1 Tax=Streptomyces sp. NPDC051217 TaxID=3365644 RepID=UPI00378783C8